MTMPVSVPNSAVSTDSTVMTMPSWPRPRPTARMSPISRVRSITASASVFTIESTAMTRERPSIAYSTAMRVFTWSAMASPSSSPVRTETNGKARTASARSARRASTSPSRTVSPIPVRRARSGATIASKVSVATMTSVPKNCSLAIPATV